MYGGATHVLGTADALFFHLAVQRTKKRAVESKTTPASAPITISAMASSVGFDPSIQDEEVDEFDPEAAPVDVSVEETPADADEVGNSVFAALEFTIEFKAVALPVAIVELTMLDRVLATKDLSESDDTYIESAVVMRSINCKSCHISSWLFLRVIV
jgi:hypothetical protein